MFTSNCTETQEITRSEARKLSKLAGQRQEPYRGYGHKLPDGRFVYCDPKGDFYVRGTSDDPVLNGNQFVKSWHVFVPGKGCFFPTLEIAIAQGTSPNGVGLWTEELEFQGKTWFQAGNTNIWD